MGVTGKDKDGNVVFVRDEDIDAAAAAGIQFDEGQSVNVVQPLSGRSTAKPLGRAISNDKRIETGEERRSREDRQRIKERRSGIVEGAKAVGEGVLEGVSLGSYSATKRYYGGEEAVRAQRERAQARSTLSIGGEIAGTIGATIATRGKGASRAGAILSKTPMGMLERAAMRVGKKTGGGFKGAVAREATVGAGIGAGAGVSAVALSEDPVTLEGAVSAISSSMLYGAGIGAVGGVLGKAAEKGLAKAQAAMAKRAAPVSDDLAGDLTRHVDQGQQSKFWLNTSKSADKELREAGKVAFSAHKKIKRMLNDPKGLAKRARYAGQQLREQEFALESILAKADDIRAGAKEGGARTAALDAVEPLLENNRRLQQIFSGLEETGGRGLPGALEGNVQSLAFSGIMGAAAAVDPTGGVLALPLATAGARKITGMLFQRLDKAAGAAELRTAAALERFLDGSKATAKAPLATAVLTKARFAPESKPYRPLRAASKLGRAFQQRAAEIRSQTVPGPDGRNRMTPSARAAMAGTWASVRQHYPMVADKLEALAARRVEFLADKLPRNPGVPTDMLGGPDTWAPSNSQMRAFARYVAAAEDPAGVVERMAATRMTTEDAETLRELYPETFAAIQRDLIARAPKLRKKLPRKKRLMLSILTGVPIEPGLDPRVLQRLQSHYAEEPGAEGGTQAPQPQPQFGSITRPEPTPAQAHS